MNTSAAMNLVSQHAGSRLSVIRDSFARLTGKELIDRNAELVAGLWQAPRVIVAAGIEADPVFFYGNQMALELFEVSAEDFIRMPSRLSAEPLLREERQQLLDRVTRHGYIDNYAGIRISSSGQRFRIEQATVWNLLDNTGQLLGQAATFHQITKGVGVT